MTQLGIMGRSATVIRGLSTDERSWYLKTSISESHFHFLVRQSNETTSTFFFWFSTIIKINKLRINHEKHAYIYVSEDQGGELEFF